MLPRMNWAKWRQKSISNASQCRCGDLIAFLD
jgi:hypothetical protein